MIQSDINTIAHTINTINTSTSSGVINTTVNNDIDYDEHDEVRKAVAGQLLTYEQFMDLAGMRGKTFVKFINSGHTHHDFKYKLGLNEDIIPFNPTGQCSSGGLYFTEMKYAKQWRSYGVNLATIELCPDAHFYIESCLTKFKTNKFILKSMDHLYISHLKHYALSTLRFVMSYNWKLFENIRFSSANQSEVAVLNNNVKLRDPTVEEQLYNHAIISYDRTILSDPQHLLMNQFNINYETDRIRTLFGYVSTYSDLCIAGGYMAMQYLQRDPKQYPNSDIDLYILNTPDFKKTLAAILNFLDICFGIKTISTFAFKSRDGTQNLEPKQGIYNVTCNNLSRTVQIICTKHTNIAEVLNGYDAGYCKVCYYLGNTYVTPDAKYVKDTNITYFYLRDPQVKRIKKAMNLGLFVMNTLDSYGERPNTTFEHITTAEEAVKLAKQIWIRDGYTKI
jgi:hypothetical protein